MSDESVNWEAAPSGPPAGGRGNQRYSELYVWLADHPGEWMVVHSTGNAMAQVWKKQGYEVTSRRISREPNRWDIYLRSPAEKA